MHNVDWNAFVFQFYDRIENFARKLKEFRNTNQNVKKFLDDMQRLSGCPFLMPGANK